MSHRSPWPKSWRDRWTTMLADLSRIARARPQPTYRSKFGRFRAADCASGACSSGRAGRARRACFRPPHGPDRADGRCHQGRAAKSCLAGRRVAQDNLKFRSLRWRKASRRDRELIRTENGRGYRFTAPVRPTVAPGVLVRGRRDNATERVEVASPTDLRLIASRLTHLEVGLSEALNCSEATVAPAGCGAPASCGSFQSQNPPMLAHRCGSGALIRREKLLERRVAQGWA